MSYFTALSRLCKYNDYERIINFRIQVFELMKGLIEVEEIKMHSKRLIKHLINFDYLSFMRFLKDILANNDLAPILFDLYDESWETIDDMFSYVPYQLLGYYGQYDAYISIDDLEGMTEHERVMAMLFMSDEFVLHEENYDKDRYYTYLAQIQDETAKKKITKLIDDKAELNKVYEYFCQDYENEQYKKDNFTERFYYLFQRIVRNTGFGLIDMCPEELDQCYSGWDELPSVINTYKEYKEKEKKHNQFIKNLQTNKKLSKRFYQFLFDEVIPRYKE